MNNVSEKYKRMAIELFAFFSKEMEEAGYQVKEVIHPIWHPSNLQEMYRFGVKQVEIEEMIAFAVKNWDQIKTVSHLKGLAQEPYFHQMLSHFKYPTLIYLSKNGFEQKEKERTEKVNDLKSFDERVERMKLCITKN